MEGWIKIHRSILHNWIFSDEEKFRAWIIILLTVNYETKKVNIGNLLLTCHRGESLLSLDSWAKLFGKNWNKSKVRRFFDLLKNDSMIVLRNEQKTTRLTVCKYDTYQDIRNDSETQTKRKRNANETQTTPTKESKEYKEVKNIIYNEFYDFEIENSNNDSNYIQFVKILFGENNSKLKLSGVLSLKNQLTFKQFELVYEEKNKNKVSLTTLLENLENRPDLLKKYSMLQRVLLNWMKTNKK